MKIVRQAQKQKQLTVANVEEDQVFEMSGGLYINIILPPNINPKKESYCLNLTTNIVSLIHLLAPVDAIYDAEVIIK